MGLTLRLTDDADALTRLAKAQGVSQNEAASRAIRSMDIDVGLIRRDLA